MEAAAKKKVSSPGFGIVAHPDGSITRLPVPKVPASPDSFAKGVASKDVTIQASTGLWARIFLPDPSSTPHSKLPLLLYFHGGGFIMMSVAFKFYHNFLLRLCKAAQIIIVAVEYRLAPEHRLPAAHEDALVSLWWLQSQALMQQQANFANDSKGSSSESWLFEFADFSCCYLMGDSSGGAMVHHLSVKIAELDIAPLCIRGQIIVQPFFGGQKRTATELRLADDEHVPLSGTDWLWRTALPHGANRDDPLANPFSPSSPDYRLLAHKLPLTLVMIAMGDPMQERQVQLFHTLKEAGVDAKLTSYEGAHGFQLQNGPSTEAFIKDLVDFLHCHATLTSKL
ncbi:hypothetical protein L7F22_051568 [Adiantum nelumboides]|nr:hypothetical protein [Adiantum nelumboides]